MNIVFSTNSNVPIFNGIAATLTAMGEYVINWDAKIKPVYDMLEELKPDYLFISKQQLDQAILEAIPQYNTKLIIYGVNIPEEVYDNTEILIVPQHVPNALMDNMPKSIKLKKAANLVQFNNGYYNDTMKCDVLYITNSGTHQRSYITNHLSGLLYTTDYKLKVIGAFKIPCANYVGKTNMSETLNFIKSSSIILDYDWDIALDIIANQSFVITNIPNDLVPCFSNEIELLELISKYTKNEKARRKLTKTAFKAIIDKDTYFHRTVELGDILGIDEWKTKALETLKRYRK